MPYTASTLSLLGNANGQAVWHYRNSDALSVICAAGYFNASAPQFNVGDEILVTRTGTNIGAVSLRVLAASATAVTVTAPSIQSQAIPMPVTAVANTEFTLTLPPCTIVRAQTVTTTAYTGNTVTAQLGTTLGGVDIVAATTIKAAGIFAHTVVAAGAKFAGGTVFVRVAQTATLTAVGLGTLSVEYVAD
jgi:hypothetical protein